jgi:pyruvate,water dikinase
MWLKLPILVFRMFRAQGRMQRQMETLPAELRMRVFPEFAAAGAQARKDDLSQLSAAELQERLRFWIDRTLVGFARVGLRPSMFAAAAMTNLENGLKAVVGGDQAAAVARDLLTGVHPDPEVDLAGAMRALAEGTLSQETFVSRFGHRGPQEMELAHPRWAEDPAGLPGGGSEKQVSHVVAPDDRWKQFVADHPDHRGQLSRLEPEFRRACEFLGLREAAKHYLLQGYDLIRRLLLEIDRRHNLNGGIFFLTPDELPRLLAGESLDSFVTARRKERQLALAIEAPAVIFSDDLESIGRAAAPIDSGTGDVWQGTPVSAGVAEGAALVLTEPPASVPAESGFILVCPSTDPAWVPLFLKCAGVVMETGGILSHGAIVAREFGVPAVVGIPDVHRRLQTGQRLRVDGNSGKITLPEVTSEKPAG